MGPKDGEKVRFRSRRDPVASSDPRNQIVLIHGLSVPAIVWKDIAPALVSQGHRVLLYGTFRPSVSSCATLILWG